MSLKRSNSLFCLLINPHDSPSRWLLRWSHPWLSSGWRPFRKGGLLTTGFCLFFKCDVSYSQRLTWNIFPGSALLSEKRQQIWRQNRTAASQQEWVEFHQQMHFLYRSFYVNMKKISTFSPDLAVTWGVCLKDFCLCPSECMLYECVTMKSLYLYLEKKLSKPSEPNWISM